MLTIAHRLSTIKKSDRVLVLDQGRVLEYDAPEVLANNPNSHFANLLRSSDYIK